MPRRTSPILTEAEQRVMEVLWRRGPSSVRAVMGEVAAQRRFAYTTIQTVLRTLQEKGYVTAARSGRAHVFSPVVARREARNSALEQLVNQFFGGSRQALAAHLVGDEELSEAALEKLERRVREARGD